MCEIKKISSRCPLCMSHKIDVIEWQKYNGYMREGTTYVIKCFGCGIELKGSNKEELFDKWNMLCDKHSICIDKDNSESINSDFIDSLNKVVCKVIKARNNENCK